MKIDLKQILRRDTEQPKKPKERKPPEDSQFLRMLWLALTFTCFYLIALVDPKVCSFPIFGFKIPLLFIYFWVAVAGSSLSYHYRHQDVKWPEYLGLVFVALFCWWFMENLQGQLLAGPDDVDFLLPAVHLVTGMYVSHSFELRTRFDFNFSLAVSLIIVCYAATLGKGAIFGFGMFVYVVLAASLLLLDCEARTFGKVQARSIDQAESYLTVGTTAGRSEKTANLVVPTLSLLSLSVCFFLLAPRAESLADQVAANLNSFVRNNILHRKPYQSPMSRFRSPVNPLKSSSADPDMWSKNGNAEGVDQSDGAAPEAHSRTDLNKGKSAQSKSRKPFSRAEAIMDKARNAKVRNSIESASKVADESDDAPADKGKAGGKNKKLEDKSASIAKSGEGGKGSEAPAANQYSGNDDDGQEKAGKSEANDPDNSASEAESSPSEKGSNEKGGKKETGSANNKVKAKSKQKAKSKGSRQKKDSKNRGSSGMIDASSASAKDSGEPGDKSDGSALTSDSADGGATDKNQSSEKNSKADTGNSTKQSAAQGGNSKKNIAEKTKPKVGPKQKTAANPDEEYAFPETLAADEPATIRDVPLFNVACNRTVPFRQGAFDNFDGHNWSVSTKVASEDVSRGYDGAYSIKNAFPLALSSSVLTIRLTQKFHIIKNLGRRIIFAGSPSELSYPGPAMSLDGCGNLKGRWSLYPGMEYTVFADDPQYDLKAMRAEPIPGELDERAIRSKMPSFTQIPDKQPEALYALSQDIAGVQDNWFVQAEKICKYLRTNYIYSDDPKYKSDSSNNSVDHFLFQTKIGDCKDFASAFVLLCRASGIPARMVVGFTDGEFDPASGTRVVKLKNYHTWGEIYFPSTGWVPFDATPQGTLPVREKEKERYFTTMEQQVEKTLSPHPSGGQSDAAKSGSRLTIPLPNGKVLQITLDLWQLFKLIPIVLAAAVLARPSWAFCKSLFNKFRLPGSVHPASKAYANLQKDLKPLGIVSAPSQTPGEFLNKVNDRLASSNNPSRAKQVSGAVEEFVSCYNAALFGSTGSPAELEQLRKNIRELMKSVLGLNIRVNRSCR